MTFGEFVFCIDCGSKRAHDLEEQILVLARLLLDLEVELLLQSNELDQVVYAKKENLRHERLAYEVHGTELQAFPLSAVTLVCRKEDNRKLGCGRLERMKFTYRLVAVHTRHLYIKQDEVRKRSVLIELLEQSLARLQCSNMYAAGA